MRLSEAIRLGSVVTERSNLFHERGTNCYCAIGAAVVAIGKDKTEREISSEALETWPHLQKLVKCPKCEHVGSLINTISHLNFFKSDIFVGFHEWTREQIADWVEKLEIENGWTGTESPVEKVTALQQ